MLPGSANRYVPPATPPVARDCTALVPILFMLTMVNIVPNASISFSTSKGAVISIEERLSDPDAPALPMERLVPSGAALAVAGELGIRGQAVCRAAACASGLVSVLAAAREVASGRADLAIAGASEASLTPFIHAGFVAMGALAGSLYDGPRALRQRGALHTPPQRQVQPSDVLPVGDLVNPTQQSESA